MAPLRSFQVTLREDIAITEREWIHQVKNLPHPSKTNQAKLVKAISFTSSAKEQHIKLRLEPAPSNRVTWSEPLDQFLLLNFANFRLREPSLREDGRVLLAPARDTSEYIARLVKTGIKLNGKRYYFFGHSNSQLKSRSCFMFSASKDEIKAKIEAMGDFSKMMTVAKKAKRIGLLFSSAEMATTLDPERCEDIDDITAGDYCFTDGCGLISEQLARLIVQRKNIVFRNRRYLPSVFQIRYRGYKGVLTLDPTMHGKIQARFRRSMKKFTAHGDLSLSVVEHSKPYTFGFLNDEVVMLLSALGVETKQLLNKQQQYLDFLDRVYAGQLIDSFQFLSFINEVKLAEKLLMDGMEAVRPALRGLVRSEQSKMLNKHEEQRCRIMIRQSRLLFGICDPSATPTEPGRLEPGTYFVRVTVDGTGEAQTLINTEVLVTRNPCLHPGDLQKFRAVDVPEWSSSLVDCIVFPTAGKRPSADLMSGGDLDGDKFFVTWDPEIIPQKMSQAAAYPGVKERINFQAITDDDRADFFAKYNNMSLGRVKSLYLKWARIKGPTSAMSPECQQLNRLFSQCVDGNRVRVPQNLEDPPEPSADTPPFILDILHEAATSHIRTRLNESATLDGLPEVRIMDLLTNRESFALSEYELVQLVLRRCNDNGLAFAEYAPFFNFEALTDEQQVWLLSRLPAIRGMTSLVKNGLLQSDLVLPEELSQFRLDDSRLHWKAVFRSNEDRMGRFLQATSQSLELFHKKLIILQADERLTLMIYVPQKVPRAAEIEVGDNVRIFALPRSSGMASVNYRVTATKSNSRLYSDGNTFQLYEGKRGNTFVYLTRGPQDQSSLVDVSNTGDRRRQAQRTIESGTNFDNRASVALNKISGPIQKHVGRMNRAGVLAAEIYVISNSDVGSMRVADQWLHFVDTEEVLPLFEPIKKEYRVPSLEDIDRASLSPAVANVVLDNNLSSLRAFSSVDEVQQIFQLLHHSNEKTRVQQVCVELINIGVAGTLAIDRIELSSAVLRLLPSTAFLAEVYLDSQLWQSTKDTLAPEGEMVLEHLCKELILSTNRMEGFVRRPFEIVLREMKQMSLQLLAELVEFITLTVEQAEFALDLLLGCLEPECSRLLLATPKETQQFVKGLAGIALDHIEEGSSGGPPVKQTFELNRDGFDAGYEVVKAVLRIDAPGGHPKVGDHVRLAATMPPQNAPLDRPYAMHAIVTSSDQATVRFRCLHHVPSYVADCSWKLRNCGSSVTSKAMFEAMTALYATKSASCRIYRQLMGVRGNDGDSQPAGQEQFTRARLNESQNRALTAAVEHPLMLLWGPPGTGKTHTVVRILNQLLEFHPDLRFLVTAPTHNAVDNLMGRFIEEAAPATLAPKPLRVSTSLSKVDPVLRAIYTVDAMVGKDLSDGFAGRGQAQKRVRESRLIFTTCAGAALGLLRSEQFGVVIVDEASQITEPGSLIPLTKGCRRAILVGDHVQLRPSAVGRHAVMMGFHVSLFERLYTAPDRDDVAKVMLDEQYRMHPDLCAFSSNAFYEGRLQTAAHLHKLQLPSSQFPWPQAVRKVFVQCEDTEDIGRQSKSNQGQVRLCKVICDLLSTSPATSKDNSKSMNEELKNGVAILTPYTRQREMLQTALPGYTVSSIDGFQGREAEIVIFVTVRSNAHHDIGFLSDMRRLNVVMTRAKAGVVIVGHQDTLMQSGEGGDEESERVWKHLIGSCEKVEVQAESV